MKSNYKLIQITDARLEGNFAQILTIILKVLAI